MNMTLSLCCGLHSFGVGCVTATFAQAGLGIRRWRNVNGTELVEHSAGTRPLCTPYRSPPDLVCACTSSALRVVVRASASSF